MTIPLSAREQRVRQGVLSQQARENKRLSEKKNRDRGQMSAECRRLEQAIAHGGQGWRGGKGPASKQRDPRSQGQAGDQAAKFQEQAANVTPKHGK